MVRDMTMTGETAVLDNYVHQLVQRRGIHHSVVAVERTERSSRCVAVAGPAQPGGDPMTPDTPFHYASVTKLYTAAVVMQLVERGDVALDQPMERYLPHGFATGLHRLREVDYSGTVTVRNLLSHTSGIADYFLDTPAGETSFTDRITQGDFAYTINDVVDRVRKLKPHFPPQDPAAPRQRARYSDTNFQLLGAIVEYVTGGTFQRAVEQRILEPLGLVGTWFAGHPRASQSPVVATMWSGETVLDRPQAMASMAPEGGLIGTVNDALTFLRALLAGELFEHESTLASMQARWNRFGFPRDRAAIIAPGWPIEYGLGIKRYQVPRLLNAGRRSPTFVGHTGASGSWLFWCPEHDLYLAGTVDQTIAAGVPYRVLPKLVKELTG